LSPVEIGEVAAMRNKAGPAATATRPSDLRVQSRVDP
jgi:hypothetical protein